MRKISLFLLVLIFSTKLYAQALLYVQQPLNKPNIDDNKMHIFLCGTGIPHVYMQKIRNPACLAVIANKQFLLFDSGEGSIQTLATMGLPYLTINNVFLTHLHSDHFAGLGELLVTTWRLGRSQPIAVYGPYGVQEVVNGFQKAYSFDILYRSIGGAGNMQPTLAFSTPTEFSTDNKGKKILSTDGINVTAFAVDHLPVFPAYGYRIEYKGCKIVISGDTRASKSLEQHSQNADVLISEVVSNPLYTEAEEILAKKTNNPKIIDYTKQIYSYHTDSLELAKMAKRAGVKKLILTHLLPSIPTDDAVKKDFIAGMDKYYSGPITVADDKDELILDSNGTDCRISYVPEKQLDIKTQKISA